MKNLGTVLVLSLVLVAQAMAGEYGQPRTVRYRVGTGDGAGVPNPAALACVALEGYGSNFEFKGGQGGICAFGFSMLPDWTLYRKVVAKESSQAVEAFLTRKYAPLDGPQETWHRRYCESLGGKVETAGHSWRQHVKYEFCEFPDHSWIEAATLFMGPSYNRELADILENVTVIIEWR